MRHLKFALATIFVTNSARLSAAASWYRTQQKELNGFVKTGRKATEEGFKKLATETLELKKIIYPRKENEWRVPDEVYDRLKGRLSPFSLERPVFVSAKLTIRDFCNEGVLLLIGSDDVGEFKAILQQSTEPHKCLFARSSEKFVEDHLISQSLLIR